MDAIVPDDKDWTWVLDRSCPDCALDARRLTVADLPGLLEDSTPRWLAALASAGVRQRPAPGVWSVLEYACHVRDVHRIFAERLALVRDHSDPTFANWDQDATAVQERYAEQDPDTVAGELASAAADVAEAYRTVRPEELQRTARRSNGSVFTLETLGRYHLHDVVHHAHDIGWAGDDGPQSS